MASRDSTTSPPRARTECRNCSIDPLWTTLHVRPPAFHQQRGIEGGRLIEVLDEAHAAALIGAAHIVEHAAQRHAALVHQGHVVRHSLHLIEQVRREDHRAPVVGHGAHDGIEDVTAHDSIEARGGLVQNQELGTMGHRRDQAGLRRACPSRAP